MFIDLSSWCLIEYTCDYVLILYNYALFYRDTPGKEMFSDIAEHHIRGCQVRCKDLLELFCEYDNYFAK